MERLSRGWAVLAALWGIAQAPAEEILGIPMVRLPAGSFVMGTSDQDRERLEELGWWSRFLAAEQPARQVVVSRPFLISRTEITVAQWERTMGGRHEPSAAKDPDLPVDSVSFRDAQAFLAALNKRGQGRFRLPTEAEWEYACRAGGWGLYFVGDRGWPVGPDRLGEFAWMRGNSGGRSRKAGALRPNAWGLHDMAGSLWEWCSDYYHPAAYRERGARVLDPAGQDPFPERVMRGGCWFLEARYLRSALRSGRREEDRSPYAGLRVVREIPGE